MSYLPHPSPTPLLFGYDPLETLPPGHLSRLVEEVVEETVRAKPQVSGPGRPAYDPRVCLKVLIYGYATGIRSSRKLQQNCREHLAYLFLARGEAPSYRTLCTARLDLEAEMEAVWAGLFAVAESQGMKRSGRLVVDSTKLRANASSESVLSAAEYAAVRQELEKVLAEAAAADEAEQSQSYWQGQDDDKAKEPFQMEQMREILRRVRRRPRAAGPGCEADQPSAPQASPTLTAAADLEQPQSAIEPKTSSEATALPAMPMAADATAASDKIIPRMQQRVAAAIKAIDAAVADGRQQVSLTDPDARMMPEGRERKLRECHSFEVAVDHGLLVVGQISPEGSDNRRLEALVEVAQKHEPDGVTAVDADSGYYSGDAIGRLLAQGLDLCVPDSHTACDLHRHQPVGTKADQHRGEVPFTYDPVLDTYTCPRGNQLQVERTEQHKGQVVKVYRARDDCSACPLAQPCLRQKGARHRTLKVGQFKPELRSDLERFNEPEHQARYRQRGPEVETVFGFVRASLGYLRWLLRGDAGVAGEARLFKTAYQFRKVHLKWAMA